MTRRIAGPIGALLAGMGIALSPLSPLSPLSMKDDG